MTQTSLHFDLRLQIGAALRSWAVPKGPGWISLCDELRRLMTFVRSDHDPERVRAGAVLSVAHRNFELTTPGGGLDVLRTKRLEVFLETIRGVESARRAFEDFFSPFEALSIEPEAFFEGDGQIVVFFLQRARPLGSSAYVERRAAHLWTMRDGKAMGLQIFP